MEGASNDAPFYYSLFSKKITFLSFARKTIGSFPFV